MKKKNEEIKVLLDNQKSLNLLIDKLIEACCKSQDEIKDLNRTIQRLQQDYYSDPIISSKGTRYIYTTDHSRKSLIQ